MLYTILVALFIFFANILYAQTTLQICNLKPTKKISASVLPIKKAMQEQFRQHKIVFCQSDKTKIITRGGTNPFMLCVQKAYAYHYNMVLSPDMIWLLITQGFASHVRVNNKTLRKKFVAFEGKKKLIRLRSNVSEDREAWTSLLDNLTAQIQNNTHQNIQNQLVKKFSTTTDKETRVYQITLLDAVSSYFEYEDISTCGIPKIILEGTHEDWKAIKVAAQDLRQYDLDWWIDILNPILDEFINASSGKANIDFWKKIFKENTEEGCLGTPSSGWAFKFFPYSLNCFSCEEGLTLRKNPVFFKKKYDLPIEELPNGLSNAPFLWTLPTKKGRMITRDMNLVGGFIGFIIEDNYTLRPHIDWLLLQKRFIKENVIE